LTSTPLKIILRGIRGCILRASLQMHLLSDGLKIAIGECTKCQTYKWLFRCYPIKFHTTNPFMKSFQQLFLRMVTAGSLKPDPSLRLYMLQLKHSFIRLILNISINILWPHGGYHACDRSVFTFVTKYAHIQWVSVVHVVLLHVFTFLAMMSV
jgi:hypothetical protein